MAGHYDIVEGLAELVDALTDRRAIDDIEAEVIDEARREIERLRAELVAKRALILNLGARLGSIGNLRDGPG
jgi:hypothetical protein